MFSRVNERFLTDWALHLGVWVPSVRLLCVAAAAAAAMAVDDGLCPDSRK